MFQIKRLIVFFICFLIVACKNSKPDLTGNTPIKAKEFFGIFKPLPIPFTAYDTNIYAMADSVEFSPKLLKQFIPDSTYSQLNLKEKDQLFPVGKIEKNNENYLVFNQKNNKKIWMHVLVFNKELQYAGYKTLLNNHPANGYLNSININREPTFITGREKINKSTNHILYTRTGWAFSLTAGVFAQVVTDTNEDEQKNNTIINPIDTFKANNKYSGDYIKNNKNFISLRDGKNENEYLFFIHFEKNNAACVGELKGTLQLKTKTEGVFAVNGDPCVIDFTFHGNTIEVKEQGTCGNYRNITCYFDDSFTKRKTSHPKTHK